MIRNTCFWLASVSLILCLTAAVLYFSARIDVAVYKNMLAVASACWFIFATAWAMRAKRH